MKVSVVIPAYNLKEYIGRCLDSVMKQTLKPFEVIVVDDGSSDNTCDVVQSYPVTLIKQENKGAAAARNRGVQEAKGEWVAFLDGDDEWLPNKIEEVAKKFKSGMDDKVVMIAHDQYEEDNHQKLHTRFDPKRPLFPQLFLRCFLSTSSIIVRRETYLKVKGMDETLPSAQDYDLWLRLALSGELIFVKGPLTKCAIREGSISFYPEKRYKCMLKIVDKYKKQVGINHFLLKLLIIHYEILTVSKRAKKWKSFLHFLMIAPFVVLYKLLEKVFFPQRVTASS